MKETYHVWMLNYLKSLVVYYDTTDCVLAIKAIEQSSRKSKVEKIDQGFSPDSTAPIP